MSLSRAAQITRALSTRALSTRALSTRSRAGRSGGTAPARRPGVTSPRRSASAVTAGGLAGAVLAVDVLLGASAASAATRDEFRRLAQCESGGNYSINTGNGYYGAYQFAASTWRSLGYSGLPHQASPAVQDEAAARLQARSGWGQWPACSRKLGLNSPRGLVDPPAPRPASEIDRHYGANAEARAGLGAPTGPEFPVRGGAVRLYQRGQVVWSGATGARAVYGDIFARYGQLRWEQGLLGYPVSDEHSVPGGRQNLFQNGVIVWSPQTGAQVLIGDIRRQYEGLGGVSSPLGFPTTGERPEHGGVSQAFAGGEVYWDAGTRATTALRGEVLAAYKAAGGPAGGLGMPIRTAASAGGTEVVFEGGSITHEAGTRTASVVTR